MAGSILSKGNNKYKLSYMKDNQRYIKTVTCESYQEAEVFLASFITEINEGKYVKPCKITLKDFVTNKYMDYYAFHNLGSETIYKHYQELRNWVFPKLGNYKLCDFTPYIWSDYFSWLSRQKSSATNDVLSAASIDRIFAVLCSVFTCAKKWQLVKSNSVKQSRSELSKKKQKKSKKAHVQERCLSYDEVYKLIDALDKVDLKYQLIIHFAIVGGLRRSEILGIKWSNVDFKNNIVKLSNSSLQTPNFGYEEGNLKTLTSHRSIYMPYTTMKLLKKYQEITPNTDNDFVFINDKGRRKGLRMSPNTITRWFRLFRKKVGLPPEVPLHGLRHTSATILISEGINIKNVSARLGHSNVDTTLDIYSHSLTTVDRLASDTIEQCLYDDADDENNPYTISPKRYKSNIRLSDLKKKKNLNNKLKE